MEKDREWIFILGVLGVLCVLFLWVGNIKSPVTVKVTRFSPTPRLSATDTPNATVTPRPLPTKTPTPTATPTRKPTSTATATRIKTPTATRTPTATISPDAKAKLRVEVTFEDCPIDWSENGGECNYQIRFYETGGLGLQVTEMGEKFVDDEGGIWVPGYFIGIYELKKVDIDVQANKYGTHKSWIRRETGKEYKVRFVKLWIEYRAVDLNHNQLSGEAIGYFPWAKPEERISPTATP